MKTCSRAKRTTTLSPQPSRSGVGTRFNVLEWPSQSLDLNPVEHLWRDLKIAMQQRSPSKLTELETICREERGRLPKYRCSKLAVSNQRRLKDVIAAKGASTKYLV
jgi:transposase